MDRWEAHPRTEQYHDIHSGGMPLVLAWSPCGAGRPSVRMLVGFGGRSWYHGSNLFLHMPCEKHGRWHSRPGLHAGAFACLGQSRALELPSTPPDRAEGSACLGPSAPGICGSNHRRNASSGCDTRGHAKTTGSLADESYGARTPSTPPEVVRNIPDRQHVFFLEFFERFRHSLLLGEGQKKTGTSKSRSKGSPKCRFLPLPSVVRWAAGLPGLDL